MSPDELRWEIRSARELSSGIIGINVLFAVRDFALLVKTAIEEGIDLVISGAGFPGICSLGEGKGCADCSYCV